MGAKLSQQIQQRVGINNEEPVSLSILLKRNLPEQAVADSVARLHDLGAVNIEYVPISGTLSCRAPLKAAESVEELDAVEYIDIESTATIEELLD